VGIARAAGGSEGTRGKPRVKQSSGKPPHSKIGPTRANHRWGLRGAEVSESWGAASSAPTIANTCTCCPRAGVIEFLAMRRVQAILVIVALLATPLALLARAVDPGMSDCNGMCCLPHGGHHHFPVKNTAPASHEDEMACHHGPFGHMMDCSMRSGQQRMDYGLIAPFPPARTSVVASIDRPKVSRRAGSQFPAVNLSAGFLAGPFQPPRS
jgi:hypothetical protein